MLKVLEGGRTVAAKVDYLALEGKVERGPGRHRKTAFPSSARKGTFIPAGASVGEAMQLLSLAEAARSQSTSTSSAPAGKGRPRRSAELDLKMARLRLAALEEPLPGDRSN